MTELRGKLQVLSEKIERTSEMVRTEEATKTAFVLPFIAALGYDVFDPAEVCPEYVADVGIKKGEKIDYAILVGGEPVILFECKHHGADLDKEHMSQLFRYYATSAAKIGVLTNGIEYRFFADLDSTNKMDSRPFLAFKVTDIPDAVLPDIVKFTKEQFDVEALLGAASRLKLFGAIKHYLAKLATSPDEDFLRLCANAAGVPRFTTAVKDEVQSLVTRAFSELISERVGSRLKSALGATNEQMIEDREETSDSSEPKEIETTAEELEGFLLIRGILREVIPAERVFSRDAKSYFSIIIDDNNRKPVCRLRFNSQRRKQIGIFDEAKIEHIHELTSLSDLYQFADQLKKVANSYN